MVKNHLRFRVTHVNPYTGLAWGEDPTIFAFDTFNEMRCPYSQLGLTGCPGPVKSWIDDIAAFIKSVDNSHLVTVGQEGFFDNSSALAVANPYGYKDYAVHGPHWAGYIGQDVESQHSSPNIDFIAIHLWPDDWLAPNLDFTARWLTAHMEPLHGDLFWRWDPTASDSSSTTIDSSDSTFNVPLKPSHAAATQQQPSHRLSSPIPPAAGHAVLYLNGAT
ncbi:hypothetical protein WJX72_009405 [[Myrmecia] bisecta]|uniref:mannan endo-1,4-beta-mannosidase n=1 Tax=[Myrmecia] bisecta TaxID=41462 RepID=A0AAW1Q1H1_9CHLO